MIDFGRITECLRELARGTEFVVVEGAGGFLVPLGQERTMADLARALGLPVVLVVGIRLGCLNHALLTGAAITASGLPFAGWVANVVAPDTALVEENIATLRAMLPAPYLGTVPHLARFDDGAVGGYIDIEGLVGGTGRVS